jgi:hypothetical protein
VEYTKLLSRAFNGAIEVNGTRIVAHPSGTLIARTPQTATPTVVQIASQPVDVDPDNDWTNV